MEDEFAAERGEVAGDDFAGDAGGVDGRAEMALDLFYGELDGGAVGGLGGYIGVDDVDEFALDLSAGLEDELGD